MKFLIDMPISPSVANWLNEKGFDAIHVSEANLGSAPDHEIIKAAQKESRIIITADLDFPRLLALVFKSKQGLILFRGGNYSEDEMLGLIERTIVNVNEEELVSSIVVVDKSRIRMRKLPF